MILKILFLLGFLAFELLASACLLCFACLGRESLAKKWSSLLEIVFLFSMLSLVLLSGLCSIGLLVCLFSKKILRSSVFTEGFSVVLVLSSVSGL